MGQSGKIFNKNFPPFVYKNVTFHFDRESFNLNELLSTEMAGQGIHNWLLSQLVTLSVQ